MNIDEAATIVSKESRNAGVNAAHRAVPIACCGWISEQELLEVTSTESQITHRSQISVEVAAVHVTLLRNVILGKSWEESLNIAKAIPREFDVKRIFKSTREYHELSTGGYAPEVMEAALYFLKTETDFTSSIQKSLAFAGSSNYCPVLVGALAGARYGFKAIPPSEISHPQVDEKLLQSMSTVAEELFKSWKD